MANKESAFDALMEMVRGALISQEAMLNRRQAFLDYKEEHCANWWKDLSATSVLQDAQLRSLEENPRELEAQEQAFNS